MSYQSFPWELGASSSLKKLNCLYIPNLKGKSVLDVGCNLGFFCGYAAFQKASYVLGIDKDTSFIRQAKQLFPQCHFRCMDWNNLDDTKFDVILFISAIHYADDQKGMLDFLMSRLNKNGILILEIGVVNSNENNFVKIKRSIDSRNFPTRIKLMEMLKDYAYKEIGKSVRQQGDPVDRYVYHIYNKIPYAILLMDKHYSGKTLLSKTIFNKDIYNLSGDYFLYNIGKQNLSNEICKIYNILVREGTYNSASFINAICNNNLLHVLLKLIIDKVKNKNFILDMYVPEKFREFAVTYFNNEGYFVSCVNIYNPEPYKIVDANVCKHYFEYLNNNYLIDEKSYLEANPDIAKAYEEGRIPNVQFHYWNFGRYENRPLHKK